MTDKTSLYEEHVADGARMVDFSGWQMPLHYGSQVVEHNAVREAAGMFDVSHMTVVDIEGAGARKFLLRLVANDVARLTQPGKALYTCMLNEQGGIIDDLIVYFRDDQRYRLVVNAATREKDLAWIRQQADSCDVDITERADLAMIAVQGPEARDQVLSLLNGDVRDAVAGLAPFFACDADDRFVARTGYTGEDGFEILLSAADAVTLWRDLRSAGVRPVGLGARDTLRLEAGMNLYGSDMDETTTPLESGLSWTVAWAPEDRDFIGRAALESQRARGILRKLVGLVLEGKGVLRNHQTVQAEGSSAGEVTSGSFSPTMGASIAFARIDVAAEGPVTVDIRGKQIPARIVKLPFVRKGKVLAA